MFGWSRPRIIRASSRAASIATLLVAVISFWMRCVCVCGCSYCYSICKYSVHMAKTLTYMSLCYVLNIGFIGLTKLHQIGDIYFSIQWNMHHIITHTYSFKARVSPSLATRYTVPKAPRPSSPVTVKPLITCGLIFMYFPFSRSLLNWRTFIYCFAWKDANN